MVLVSIMALGGLVAFFFYHRAVTIRLENSLLNFEAELDYMEDVLQLMRVQYSELDKKLSTKSQAKKAPKRSVGRPMNPNSARQKKLRGEK